MLGRFYQSLRNARNLVYSRGHESKTITNLNQHGGGGAANSVELSSRAYSSGGFDNQNIATYEEVKDLPNHPEKLLIDVREPEELQETGKIPTSINIPLNNLESVFNDRKIQENFQQIYGHKFPDFEDEIIFTCRSGRRAQTALENVSRLGYKNVKNYRGSWLDWAEREGLPK